MEIAWAIPRLASPRSMLGEDDICKLVVRACPLGALGDDDAGDDDEDRGMDGSENAAAAAIGRCRCLKKTRLRMVNRIEEQDGAVMASIYAWMNCN